MKRLAQVLSTTVLILSILEAVTVDGTTKSYRSSRKSGITDIWNISIPNWAEEALLDGNSFGSIPFGYFVSLPQLTRLDLDSNQINFVADYAFIDLSNLIWLDFWNNKLEVITVRMLKGLYILEELWLYKNHIHTLQLGCFSELTNLKHLLLNDNQLKTVPEGVFYPNHLPIRLSYFTIHENPLLCDCQIFWILAGEGKWITINGKYKTICSQPPSLSGTSWSTNITQNLNCTPESGKYFSQLARYCRMLVIQWDKYLLS